MTLILWLRQVELKVNKMASIHTQVPYDYYALKFCKPKGGVTQVSQRPRASRGSLQVLVGSPLFSFCPAKVVRREGGGLSLPFLFSPAPQKAQENLGEFLTGDRIENSPYQARAPWISMRHMWRNGPDPSR